MTSDGSMSTPLPGDLTRCTGFTQGYHGTHHQGGRDLYDAVDLAIAALDEVHVAGHGFLELGPRAIGLHMPFELCEVLHLGLEDHRPVARHEVDQHTAVLEAVVLVPYRDHPLEPLGQLASLARLATKDVANQVHARFLPV